MGTVQSMIILLATVFSTKAVFAQVDTNVEARQAPDASVLNEEQWEQLDLSLKRGLTWLVTQQKDDGSFASPEVAQPAVTSFCLMAFLAQGESPVDGQYQQQLSKAINFIVAQQKPNGLIALSAPRSAPIPRDVDHETVGNPSVYNHAISGLALTQAYGQCQPEQAEKHLLFALNVGR